MSIYRNDKLGIVIDTKKAYFWPWYINAILFVFYIFGISNSPLYTSVLDYQNIVSDPFDGAINPIDYNVNFVTLEDGDRLKNFNDIGIDKISKIPEYDIDILSISNDDIDYTDESRKDIANLKRTYPVVYMGTYKNDYKEYTGSHPAIDIMGLAGTPIMSIANGVVVKVTDSYSGFGKHVVVRHDNVPYNGTIATYYSSYSHLDKIYAVEGTKIKKGEVVGELGDTGTATSPHLHFQIDTDEAPFYPYWPFTAAEQNEAGYSFFEAINAGLGKENGLLYTVHPMKFIYDNYKSVAETIIEEEGVELASASDEIITSEIVEEEIDSTVEETIIDNAEKELVIKDDNVVIQDETTLEKLEIVTGEVEIASIDDSIVLSSSYDEMIEEHKDELEVEEEGDDMDDFLSSMLSKVNDEEKTVEVEDTVTEDVVESISEEETENSEEGTYLSDFFSDVSSSYKYFDAIKYMKDKDRISGYNDNTFKPENYINRAEVLKMIVLGYGDIKSKDDTIYFTDISSDDWFAGYISNFVAKGILDISNDFYYPYKNISKVEALKLIVKYAGVDIDEYTNCDMSYDDISKESWIYKYACYSLEKGLFESSSNFNPDENLTRGKVVDIMYKLR